MDFDRRRMTNPTKDLLGDVETRLADLGNVVVQFDEADAYSPELLTALNDICRAASDNLEVRFYRHYPDGFDASILKHLPDVKALSLDCLDTITNETALSDLHHLSRLQFGVYEYDNPSFLDLISFNGLKHLILRDSRKRKFDLSFLSRGHDLEMLSVDGALRGVETVAALPKLKSIMLRSLKRGSRLAFLQDVAQLDAVTLLLGGHDDIEDFRSETLRTLQVIQVRGFQNFGDLSRFPILRNLNVQAQLQLEALDITGAQLERLSLTTCKRLKTLKGLEAQTRLQHFSSREVALDSDALRDFAWPKSMKSVRINAKGRVWNAATAKALTARGYSQDVPFW